MILETNIKKKKKSTLTHSKYKPNKNGANPPPSLIKLLAHTRELLNRVQRSLFPPSLVMVELLCGHWMSQAIIAAAQLRVADALGKQNKDIDALAKEVKANPEALYRLMRTLASAGIFKEIKPKVFKNTRLSFSLQTHNEKSVHDICLLHGLPFHWNSWGDLHHSVKTGQPSLEKHFGGSLFDYLRDNPEESAVFDRAMDSWSGQVIDIISSTFDFSRYAKVIDIGGGNGAFMKAITTHHPKVSGAVFDQSHVVTKNKADRINYISGSFFNMVPEGYDLYILKNILHDWNDRDAIRILKNIHRSMHKDSKLLIVETIVPDGNSYHMSKMLDLEMLAITKGGIERSYGQFTELAHHAGFSIKKVHQFPCLESALELIPLFQ